MIQLIPIDGMESTLQYLPNISKARNSILPFERSDQANFGRESPKSPSNSNGVSPETNEIQGKQNTGLDPPQLSASKYVSKLDGNRGHNSGKDSGELVGAQANQNVEDGANKHHKEARKTIPQQSTSDNSPTKLA
ncbi:hypothetical protein KY290_036594 [Solanum tuberosum]|uniref:Uncharacterized protein n=1 Tax=Solanum tuberosum TaxID=4113 RepID=A0ABQ7TT39_SOLTU|nr:hypothetical protein KY285_035919 [Solanum tuberosum]KAH0737889.1 hypothetical protein KY290_036594 [Solanum tuberosum]